MCPSSGEPLTLYRSDVSPLIHHHQLIEESLVMSDKSHVFDVTDADFETAVLKRSLETPVLVDFGRLGVLRAAR